MKASASIHQHQAVVQPSDQFRFAGKYTISYRNFVLCLLLLVTFILYSGALRNHFLIGWDDGEYLSSPLINGEGPIDMPEIFSSFQLGMYQPLAVLSFALNHKISGNIAWPFILVNILLHLVNTWLVFRLTERWMKGWIPGIITAIFFALHPMHVEAVAWISTRSSGLFSLFYLLGLLAWDKYLKGMQMKHYLLALLFGLLALFSKSMAATFPVVLFLMDFFQKRPFSKKVILEKLPFLALSILFGIIAIKAAGSFGHISELQTEYSILQRFFLILYALGFYLIKFIIPLNLSAIYAFPELVNGFLPAYVYLTAIVPVLTTAGIWISGQNRHEFAFAGLFFLITISMVLPLYWSRIFITADRYTYLPYIGLGMIVARWLTRAWNSRKKLDKSTLRYLIAASGLVLFTLSAATASRIRIWRDTPLLLTDVIEKKRSDVDLAHGYFYLANYYDAADNVDEALKFYNLALSRNANYPLALNNRGILKGKTGNPVSAIKDFDNAIKTKPDYAEAWYNRGLATYQTGAVEQACEDWQKALSLGFKPARDALWRYCQRQDPPTLDPPPDN
ncbi:MAG: tetratricopeptide repeat protein [Lentimicrobium sp.]|jgi:tetratricopeptide (TPR) repeat protein|nr:tetratricopeptide repeat protein [Lentimicrobium sp.]